MREEIQWWPDVAHGLVLFLRGSYDEIKDAIKSKRRILDAARRVEVRSTLKFLRFWLRCPGMKSIDSLELLTRIWSAPSVLTS